MLLINTTFINYINLINLFLSTNTEKFIIIEKIFTISTFLFLLGLTVVALNYKNLLISLIGVDISLIAVKLTFALDYYVYATELSIIYVLLIFSISAIENTIGITIIILSFAVKKKITFDQYLISTNDIT